ncbi:MAG: DUF3108 domain-containing protein [Pseudohongiella sp.]|uniref:DUF3108 domain-containing protein n=1 Tax=Pseudohongiella sp. TaxID=1979412 RepID=UPI0034A09C7A
MTLFRNTIGLAAIAVAVVTVGADSRAHADQDAPAAPALIAPTPYEAGYEARARGLSTDAYRHLLQTGDNVYQLSHGLSLKVLGANLITVAETSHFYWLDSGAVPVSYAFRQSGLRKREETISFDWESGSASVSRDDRQSETAISAGLLDNLSFTAQMSAQLNARPELLVPGTTLEYEILDGTEPEMQTYQISARETVDTLAGPLDTVMIERVREPEADRSTIIWLALAHEFVLAKLVQIEEGDRTELLLETLTMGDISLGTRE